MDEGWARQEEGGGGANEAGAALAGCQEGCGDLLEEVAGELIVHGIAGVELLEVDPLWSRGGGHAPTVAMDPLAGNAGLVFGVVEERYGIEWRSEHEDTAVGLQYLFKRGAGAVAVLERVFGGDPFGEGAEGGDAGVGVVAAEGAGPVPDRFMQDAVVAGGVGGALIEDRYFGFVIVFKEGFEVDVGDEGAGGAEGVEQGPDNDIHAAGDRADRTNGGMDHEGHARGDAEALEISREGGAYGGHILNGMGFARAAGFGVLVVALGYAGLCVLLYLFQSSLIYFPTGAAEPEGVQRMRLYPSGAPVLVLTRPHAGRKALIYFGGNAEDVAMNLPEFARLFPDTALYLMRYRGYGGSAGSPSEAALILDGMALFDRVKAEHEHVVVIGRSLGSGVAVQVAAARPVDRLVLVTPFDSLLGLAERQFPYLPVRWLLRDQYLSSAVADIVRAPTLLIAAGQDEVIPRWSTELLRTRFQEGVAEYAVVAGAGHNTIGLFPEYSQLLRKGVGD